MLRIALVVLVVAAGVSAGAADDDDDDGPRTAATPAADPVAETRRAAAELEALEQSPIGQAAGRLHRQAEGLSRQAEDRREQLRKLYDSPEYAAYFAKRDELEARLGTKWAVERVALGTAARRLYAERHAQLRKLGAPELKEAPATGIDVLTYPRVDGSTSTHPLSVVIASRVLGVGHEWVYPGPRGRPWLRASKADDRLFLPGTEPEEWEDDEFQLAAAFAVARPSDPGSPAQHRLATMVNGLLAGKSGTHGSLVNLVEGKCDLVFTVRGPSASERALAAGRGVEIELTPVARDALVMIVNRRNAVRNLTSEQVRGIFKGELNRWSQLEVLVEDDGRGPDKALEAKDGIRAYTRERDSGSRELFEAMVMRDRARAAARQEGKDDGGGGDELIARGMGGPFNVLTLEEDGISYSVWYYEHFMAASPLTRTVAIDGVAPDAETIASGAYPYVVPVYAARRKGEPADTPASRLLNWLVSPEGQSVVRESGYVPAH